MVVLLAIAGAIAAVLLSRGNEAADQLASSDFGVEAGTLDNQTLCRSAGHGWHGNDGCKTLAGTNSAGNHTDANCKSFNPRWQLDPDNANNCMVTP